MNEYEVKVNGTTVEQNVTFEVAKERALAAIKQGSKASIFCKGNKCRMWNYELLSVKPVGAVHTKKKDTKSPWWVVTVGHNA